MNLLSLVISLLLILSFGAMASLEQYRSAKTLAHSYEIYFRLSRKLLARYETQAFKQLPGKRVYSQSTASPYPAPKKTSSKRPSINPYCARINLFPLVLEGKENHPELYQWVLQLLQSFYKETVFVTQTESIGQFLDLWLIAIRKAGNGKVVPLEKVSFGHVKWQKIYYSLLIGHASVFPLLDWVKLEHGSSRLCLEHAHPILLQKMFPTDIAEYIVTELYEPGALVLSIPDAERFQIHHSAFLTSSEVTLEESEASISLRRRLNF